MSKDYPYSVSTGRLKDFFAGIQRMGIPTRINTSVLPSMGFKSTNDRAIPPILKVLQLIDDKGVPTTSWQAMRNKQTAPTVLAQKIRAAYPSLFELYPDANTRAENEIRDFMQANTKAGERAVSAMATTFKVLCSMANFSESSDAQEQIAGDQQTTAQPPVSVGRASTETTGIGVPVNASIGLSPQIAINLQIQLPENADSDYLDNVFESMARHLLGRQPEQEDVAFMPEEEDSPDSADPTSEESEIGDSTT